MQNQTLSVCHYVLLLALLVSLMSVTSCQLYGGIYNPINIPVQPSNWNAMNGYYPQNQVFQQQEYAAAQHNIDNPQEQSNVKPVGGYIFNEYPGQMIPNTYSEHQHKSQFAKDLHVFFNKLSTAFGGAGDGLARSDE